MTGRTEEVLLVSDVDATNARFGLIAEDGRVLYSSISSGTEFATIADAIGAFLARAGSQLSPRAASSTSTTHRSSNPGSLMSGSKQPRRVFFRRPRSRGKTEPMRTDGCDVKQTADSDELSWEIDVDQVRVAKVWDSENSRRHAIISTILAVQSVQASEPERGRNAILPEFANGKLARADQ